MAELNGSIARAASVDSLVWRVIAALGRRAGLVD